MKHLFAVGILFVSQLAFAVPDFKALPEEGAFLSVLAFKNLDYAIRLDDKAKLVFFAESDSGNTCSDAVKLLDELGENEKATNYECTNASGTQVGISTPDGYKVSFILLSKQSQETEQEVFDHEIYHALRHAGTDKQIAEFHKYINTLTNGRIDLSVLPEEDAARIVGKLSKVSANSDLSALLNRKAALHVTPDSPLDQIFYISPSVVRVYEALVSIHKCEPDDPVSFIKSSIASRAELVYLYTSPGYQYVKALSDGEPICSANI